MGRFLFREFMRRSRTDGILNNENIAHPEFLTYMQWLLKPGIVYRYCWVVLLRLFFTASARRWWCSVIPYALRSHSVPLRFPANPYGCLHQSQKNKISKKRSGSPPLDQARTKCRDDFGPRYAYWKNDKKKYSYIRCCPLKPNRNQEDRTHTILAHGLPKGMCLAKRQRKNPKLEISGQ